MSAAPYLWPPLTTKITDVSYLLVGPSIEHETRLRWLFSSGLTAATIDMLQTTVALLADPFQNASAGMPRPQEKMLQTPTVSMPLDSALLYPTGVRREKRTCSDATLRRLCDL